MTKLTFILSLLLCVACTQNNAPLQPVNLMDSVSIPGAYSAVENTPSAPDKMTPVEQVKVKEVSALPKTKPKRRVTSKRRKPRKIRKASFKFGR